MEPSAVISVIQVETLTFTPTDTAIAPYVLTFSITSAEEADQITSFTADITNEVSGAINGTVSGKMNINGCDSVYAAFTDLTIGGQPVYLTGNFAGASSGDFVGKIMVGDAPAAVESIAIGTATGVAEAQVGGTLQMTAVLTPESTAEVTWAVWSNDRDVYATIDRVTGVLSIVAMPADGNVLVIANTLDPNVTTQNYTVNVTPSTGTEVTASVEPTYTIVIPSAVDFGTLQKIDAIKEATFTVEATDVFIEDGASINVAVTSDFVLASGSEQLPYKLYNGNNDEFSGTATGLAYTSFTSTGTDDGKVTVNQNDITAAGDYAGTMTFAISYVLP